jgi:hypothetical protein
MADSNRSGLAAFGCHGSDFWAWQGSFDEIISREEISVSGKTEIMSVEEISV